MNDWNDAERRVEKAQELFEQHRWNEALEELRAAISINPYNSGWFFNIGLTLDEMERFDEAIDAYQHALEIDPDDLQAMQHLGVDLHRLGNLRKALKTFEKMEAVDASCEASYCHRIMIYTDMGDHERAEEMFYLARLYKEHCPHCYYNMGCSLRDRRQFDKAIYCWQKTLDLDDSYPQVQVRIAEALWGKGELESARQHFLIGLRQDPGNTRTVLDLGELLSEMGRWEEAGEKFRRAIELTPEEPAGYFYYGQWLGQTGQDADAISSLTKTLSLDPTFPGAHLRLAELYQSRRDASAARQHLRAEMMLRPQEPDFCWTCRISSRTPARIGPQSHVLSGSRSLRRLARWAGRICRLRSFSPPDMTKELKVAGRRCDWSQRTRRCSSTWRSPLSDRAGWPAPPSGPAGGWRSIDTMRPCNAWNFACAFLRCATACSSPPVESSAECERRTGNR